MDQAVAAYKLHGDMAFDIITPDHNRNLRDGFAFILDMNGTIVSHGNDPDMVGRTMAFSDVSSGWHHAMDTRTWLYTYDGYVFGSSYDIHSSMVEAVVQNMVHLDNAGYNVTELIDMAYDTWDGTAPFLVGPGD